MIPRVEARGNVFLYRQSELVSDFRVESAQTMCHYCHKISDKMLSHFSKMMINLYICRHFGFYPKSRIEQVYKCAQTLIIRNSLYKNVRINATIFYTFLQFF